MSTPTGMDDPRVHEYRAARTELMKGLSASAGARDHYRAALPAYLDFMADFCPENSIARKHLMASLAHGHLDDHGPSIPLGAILIAFRATDQDADWIREQEPEFQAEPVDEQDNLNLLGHANYRLYLRSPHWQAVRKAALERAGHRCQLCNDHRGTLEVHHRVYRGRTTRYGNERPDDVIVLCGPCHGRHHGHIRKVA